MGDNHLFLWCNNTLIYIILDLFFDIKTIFKDIHYKYDGLDVAEGSFKNVEIHLL